MNTENQTMDANKPWGPNPIANSIKNWLDAKEYFDGYIKDMDLNAVTAIDEVAIMFRNPLTMRDFIFDAVAENGVTMFNTAHDRVQTSPLETEYGVDYAFLQIDSMRLECMVMTEGFSPLHIAMMQNHSRPGDYMPVPIHMSFKVARLEDYFQVCRELREDIGPAVQYCTSTYGEFSYFSSDAFPLGLYLKPRVNTRDAVPTGPIKPGEAFQVLRGGL